MTGQRGFCLLRLSAICAGLVLGCTNSGCVGSRSPADGPGPHQHQPPTPPTEELRRDCEALVQAPPSAWATSLAPVHDHGTTATPVLLELLERHPTAPGARAAVALLGKLGDPSATPALLELLADRGELAIEAALALGSIAHPDTKNVLVETANDRFADATIRTAAACSAVRLGAGAEVADLLVAVLIAGTPTGQESGRRLGLAFKTRWAYERYLIQRLLRDLAPELESFDTDAPWSDLAAASQRVGNWLRR